MLAAPAIRMLVVALLMTVAASSAARAESPAPDSPRLVAAVFRSAWCGQCRILDPRIEDVRREFAGEPIGWVEFDFTLGARRGLRQRAEAEGIAEIYDRLAGRSGFLVLMDRQSGQVIEIVTARYGRPQIRDALERALAVIGRPDFPG